MPASISRVSRDPSFTSIDVVLREARRLHRAAASDARSVALPVLRRLVATQAVPFVALPALFRARATVQRKHVLRALAVEAGHPHWDAYREALASVDASTVRRAFDLERGASTLKLWFASEADAIRFAAVHGGQAVRVAAHAVVLPERRDACDAVER